MFWLIVICSVITAVAFLAARRRRIPPLEQQNIKVTEINIFPVKSMAGIKVQEAAYTQEGFEFDRNWMIVDVQKGIHLSPRDNRGIKLILIRTEIKRDANSPHGGELVLSFPPDSGYPTFSVPLKPSAEELAEWEIYDGFAVWGDELRGAVVPSLNPEINPSELISRWVGLPVKLVMRPQAHSRPLDYEFLGLNIKNRLGYNGGPSTVYADKGPVTAISTATLEKARADVTKAANDGTVSWDTTQSLSMDRWRPNLVLEGVQEPFGEDNFLEGEIGASGQKFVFPGRTPRCIFPNVDPVSGVRHPHVPHKVMMKYRRVESFIKRKYCFGVYGIPATKTGIVRVGDRLRVTVTRKNPVYSGPY